MRLSWKLFCSMVAVAALALSLGGSALISSQFNAGLDREVSALLEEGDLLRYALATEAGTEATAQQLAAAAQGLADSTANRAISFALRTADGTVLAASGSFINGPLPTPSEKGQRCWVLEESDPTTWLLAATAPVPNAETTIYLENQRNVNGLYAQRDEQYRLFASIEGAAVAATGLLAALISLWILRPLRSLSAATRAMAQGDLHRRVPVKGNDELSALSQDFNYMAAQTESHVNELTLAAQRQKDFIGAFAHEIKTPLTSIIGFAELLQTRPADPEQTRESAQYIFREGRRLEALSRKLLNLIVLDERDHEQRPLALDTLLAQVAGALRPTLASEGIHLSVHCEPVTLVADPDLMGAACLNLLDNARKACLSARPTGPSHIALTGRRTRDSYVIVVGDDGVGMAAEELDRITEAFYMVDKSRSRAQGGAGLGLALCQRIVELHHGSLTFESTPGAGTMARITLPTAEPEALAPPTSAPGESHERP